MWQPCTLDTAVEYYRTMSLAFPDLALMVYGNSRAFPLRLRSGILGEGHRHRAHRYGG